ncbi:hypothetical protein ColLi_09075 [Colletotrichum liriopes]|uniref:Uncharacterized protein n=1 Tax=Colletotrichum liriopes TaxID=708192 RepID=A0AA37GTI4_9PEZI|nr:hypothetical protein ColLi_09075 [Colletotrichum liriopes]
MSLPPLPNPSDSESPPPLPSEHKPKPEPTTSPKSTPQPTLQRSRQTQASSTSTTASSVLPPIVEHDSDCGSSESKTDASHRRANLWTTEDIEKLIRFLIKAYGPLTIKIVAKYMGRDTTDVAATIVSLRQSAEAVKNETDGDYDLPDWICRPIANQGPDGLTTVIPGDADAMEMVTYCNADGTVDFRGRFAPDSNLFQ